MNPKTSSAQAVTPAVAASRTLALIRSLETQVIRTWQADNNAHYCRLDMDRTLASAQYRAQHHGQDY